MHNRLQRAQWTITDKFRTFLHIGFGSGIILINEVLLNRNESEYLCV